MMELTCDRCGSAVSFPDYTWIRNFDHYWILCNGCGESFCGWFEAKGNKPGNRGHTRQKIIDLTKSYGVELKNE